MSRVRKIRQMDHRSYDSFVWFFSGHGTENAVYGHDKEICDSLEIQDVIDMFQPSKCRSLEAKPKVCILLEGCLFRDARHILRLIHGGDELTYMNLGLGLPFPNEY